MKKVGFFHFPKMENFHGYSIDSLDPLPYFKATDSYWRRRVALHKLYQAKWIDQMYREKHPAYMRFLRDFVDKFQDADLLVLSTYNPVHPDVLLNQLEKPIKVLGFNDDPHSTYVAGIPYLWAFDGAFHISPSYNDQFLFKEALNLWGCPQSYWLQQVPPRHRTDDDGGFWPLTPPREYARQRGDSFFRDRDLDVIFISGFYRDKLDRLIQLRTHFGSRFQVYGRWPLAGYAGVLPCLLGKPAFWKRVPSISDVERRQLYYRTKIGFDLHRSHRMDVGNMRMYEVAAHGLMLLCDKGGRNAHEQIFVPDQEAVFYDSMEDAIEKIKYYLEHDDQRERIARAGFVRVHRDYDGETNLKRFLDWASSLPKRRAKN